MKTGKSHLGGIATACYVSELLVPVISRFFHFISFLYLHS